ncbi:hypothetical protein [Jannaschia sp. W003]|uniref:hypothetical protein n=1 Tax=Jannaschia sp. W003 TaxID=2867012 RepID=UPI0021A8A7CA|nr:hypothetical protein [Jannaschia sp. W003]UWQ22170.1 hypothetical protein K3554_03820 [Jannaschia sp. W003]
MPAPSPAPQAPSRGAAPLLPLAPSEPVRFDAAVLARFCRREGANAETAIGDLLVQIEERLVLAAWQGGQGEWEGLGRSAGALERMGARIGMTTLVRAAAAVRDCLHGNDPVALPACAARLARLGEGGRLEHWRLERGEAPE